MDDKLYEALVTRMDDQKDAIADLKKTVTDGFSQMNGRVRKTEKDVERIKTITGITGTGTAAVLGWLVTHWGSFKSWLTSP